MVFNRASVTVYQVCGFPSLGSSYGCYVSISINKMTKKTSVITKPVSKSSESMEWTNAEHHEFPLDVSSSSPIILKCFRHSFISGKGEALGAISIPLSEVDLKAPKRKFYFLDGITDPKIKLSVLVRFYDAPSQQSSKINVKQQGTFKDRPLRHVFAASDPSGLNKKIDTRNGNVPKLLGSLQTLKVDDDLERSDLLSGQRFLLVRHGFLDETYLTSSPTAFSSPGAVTYSDDDATLVADTSDGHQQQAAQCGIEYGDRDEAVGGGNRKE